MLRIGGTQAAKESQNMSNYMYILWTILNNCPNNGEEFLTQMFLSPHYDCFNYDYEFNDRGEIKTRIDRHFTERSRHELDRYRRIAIDSVFDYHNKNNRNISNDLNNDEIDKLIDLCKKLNASSNYNDLRTDLVLLVEDIEKRIIINID